MSLLHVQNAIAIAEQWQRQNRQITWSPLVMPPQRMRQNWVVNSSMERWARGLDVNRPNPLNMAANQVEICCFEMLLLAAAAANVPRQFFLDRYNRANQARGINGRRWGVQILRNMFHNEVFHQWPAPFPANLNRGDVVVFSYSNQPLYHGQYQLGHAVLLTGQQDAFGRHIAMSFCGTNNQPVTRVERTTVEAQILNGGNGTRAFYGRPAWLGA
ncbi:hypothetical protein ONV78_26795 [Hahella sp. CR1]|uniref:hypothetical protein n=1 Tax=Hahella sp. CR1 TaxID=2992807 RepID=UPI00244313ED|nr:hypothetical protein [Hahella sp. CR1]MDG9671371.1 hypothetical protein [Hahella sp. CR1]